MNELMEEVGEIQSMLDSCGFYELDSKIEEVENSSETVSAVIKIIKMIVDLIVSLFKKKDA